MCRRLTAMVVMKVCETNLFPPMLCYVMSYLHIRENSILNSFHESTLLYSTQYLACTFFWYYYYSFCTILLNARKKNAM